MRRAFNHSAVTSRVTALVCGLLLLALSIGCVSEPKAPRSKPSSSPKRGGIEEINLLAIPVALNMDDKPGLDGFAIKVYANNPGRPKSLPIEEGSIEVFMFDGVLGVTSEASSGLLRTWQYSADDLKRFEMDTSIGPCYQLAPLWGDAVPASNRISVVVRYTGPDRQVVNSAPSIISVALR